MKAIWVVSQRSPSSPASPASSNSPTMGGEQAEAALQHAGRPGRPVGGERRGGDPGEGRPAGVQRLGLRAVGEELHQPRGLAAGDAERVGGLLGVEPAQAGGRRGGGEDAADRGRVEAAQVHRAGVGEADPRGDLIAADGGGDQLPAAGAGRLADRQHGRGDDGAGVDQRHLVGVVEVERVHHRSRWPGPPDRRRPCAAAPARSPPARRPSPGRRRAAPAVRRAPAPPARSRPRRGCGASPPPQPGRGSGRNRGRRTRRRASRRRTPARP